MKQTTFTVILIMLLFGLGVWFRNSFQNSYDTTSNEIVVGVCPNFKPFAFTHENELIGFDIDLITELAKRIGKKVTFKQVPFELLIPQLRLQEADIIIGGLSVTNDRAQLIRFTKPYLVNDYLTILSKKTDAYSEEKNEVENKKIAVVRGSTGEQVATTMTTELVRVATPEEALQLVLSNQVDAFITNASSLAPLLETDDNERFTLRTLKEKDENIAFGINRDRIELINEIERTLQQLDEDGTLEQMKATWKLNSGTSTNT